MKLLTTCFLLAISTLGMSQTDTTRTPIEWPYSMPLLGKQASERGYKIQLPYGLNVNYVYNRLDLEITRFNMSVGDNPDSDLNKLIQKHVTAENLNFENTIARSNGMNIRADVWILPFLNVYGLYASTSASTEVSMQPRFFDQDGNLVISIPEVTSRVDFDANTYGIGSTIVGKIYEDYFFSVDGNLSWSNSDLLDKAAKLAVASARLGERIKLGKETFISLYVGGMYRGFLDSEGNAGSITISEALPDLGSELLPAIDEKVSDNNERIAELNPNNPLDQAKISLLQKENEILREIETSVEGVLGSNVNYDIKKELINNWSVQFGFNLEINPSITFRGEFGKGVGNDFVLLGFQYRFGI